MSLPVQSPPWRDNSQTHNSTRTTRTCPCGNSYTTPETNPYKICPECQEKLVREWWESWDETNG